MGEPTTTKVNSLASLLGQYMSDSDNEEVQPSTKATTAKDRNNVKMLKGDAAKKIQTQTTLLTTFWTECLDQSTGHPYYWNIETKEVTWDKPAEYIDYLNSVKSMYSPLPEDSWSVGYSDDSSIPYYVNEITRVVSWEKPANFKEKPAATEAQNQMLAAKQEKLASQPDKVIVEVEKKGKISRKRPKKEKTKKALPKHLLSTQSDDEKIEVISEYVEAGVTSSEEEVSPNIEAQGKRKESKKQLNLVAAYATDSGSEGDSNMTAKKSSTSKQAKSSAESGILETIEVSSTALDIDANSFASIITGGKTGDVNMDEELNKFKEELEDMQLAAATDSVPEEVPEVKEQSFDQKTFKRKRRIEFVGNVKQSPLEEKREKGSSMSSADSNAVRVPEKAKPRLIAFQKSHVEFETKAAEDVVEYGPKPLTPEPQSDQNVAVASNDGPDLSVEIADLCELLTGKVKFLSVGKPEVSPVQVMSIQLEALQAAFSASCLDSDYFFKWLKTTSDDLQSLEQNAAPQGWKCNWDRANSQYCYKNIETNETRWEFPVENVPIAEKELSEVTQDNGEEEKQAFEHDDDAMDICTTPPPPASQIVRVGSTYQWDPGNAIQVQESAGPADIIGELASFYSDIANIDPTASNLLENEPPDDLQQANVQGLGIDDTPTSASKRAKRRKKVKVPGLGSKMQEVSTMVANWQKAQKELDN